MLTNNFKRFDKVQNRQGRQGIVTTVDGIHVSVQHKPLKPDSSMLYETVVYSAQNLRYVDGTKCPECGADYAARCKCMEGHATCPNGHSWLIGFPGGWNVL